MNIKTQEVWGELCLLPLSLLIAVVAPDVKPDQRYSPLGLGTRSTWRKEEYKNTPMGNKGRENIQLLPQVTMGEEECHDLD